MTNEALCDNGTSSICGMEGKHHAREWFFCALRCCDRIQRLREAAGSRSHLTSPALRDLALQPYTFVASAAPGTEDGGQHDRLGEGVGRGGGEEDGWDDWGEEHSDGDVDGSMVREKNDRLFLRAATLSALS